MKPQRLAESRFHRFSSLNKEEKRSCWGKSEKSSCIDHCCTKNHPPPPQLLMPQNINNLLAHILWINNGAGLNWEGSTLLHLVLAGLTHVLVIRQLVGRGWVFLEDLIVWQLGRLLAWHLSLPLSQQANWASSREDWFQDGDNRSCTRPAKTQGVEGTDSTSWCKEQQSHIAKGCKELLQPSLQTTYHVPLTLL